MLINISNSFLKILNVFDNYYSLLIAIMDNMDISILTPITELNKLKYFY
jgi:hypothetical protein